MCSQTDTPPYDDPEPGPITQPRRYVLAGGAEPTPSVALAVLGTMLTEAEGDLDIVRTSTAGPTTRAIAASVVDALRRARNRVAEAER